MTEKIFREHYQQKKKKPRESETEKKRKRKRENDEIRIHNTIRERTEYNVYASSVSPCRRKRAQQ